jgi:CheY-like chemotaxis protein
MNAIIGMTELVLDSPLSAEQREFLNVVSESGEALLDILNEILDFSKIEAGKLVLEPRVFDLRESVGDTLKSLGVRAHKKGLELACHIRPGVPQMVVGDSARLRQILTNLVGNAIKFTEVGDVIVEVDCRSRHDGDAILHFAVSDTGIGIPREKQERIFAAFEQADGSVTRRFGGTGLGLAICSRLTKLMGGHISVESEPGKGSTFYFTASFGVADEKSRQRLAPEPTRLIGVRVLIVDDNAASRRILKETLERWGMTAACASGACEALEMVDRAVAGGNPYQLILTDSQMPETDGFGLAEKLRFDQRLNSTMVMMLTSSDQKGDIDRCESLGIASCIRKPVKQSELFEALAGSLIPSAPDTGSQKPSPSRRIARFEPLRILIAEDSLVNQKLIVGLLEKYGNAVQVAANGREALVALESGQFDLVLMDVQMPEMDGYEATAEIRRRERVTRKHIPIIALTANAMKQDRDRCLEAGMDEYIAKPIRAEQLFDTIALVWRQTQMKSKREPLGRADSTLVDWEEAIRSVDGDGDVLHNLVEGVLQEAPNMLHAVRQAVGSRDGVNLMLAASTLKGAIRYFGAKRVFDRAFELERMGRDGRLEGADEIGEALASDMQQLLRELSEYVQAQRAG